MCISCASAAAGAASSSGASLSPLLLALPLLLGMRLYWMQAETRLRTIRPVFLVIPALLIFSLALFFVLV